MVYHIELQVEKSSFSVGDWTGQKSSKGQHLTSKDLRCRRSWSQQTPPSIQPTMVLGWKHLLDQLARCPHLIELNFELSQTSDLESKLAPGSRLGT